MDDRTSYPVWFWLVSYSPPLIDGNTTLPGGENWHGHQSAPLDCDGEIPAVFKIVVSKSRAENYQT